MGKPSMENRASDWPTAPTSTHVPTSTQKSLEHNLNITGLEIS